MIVVIIEVKIKVVLVMTVLIMGDNNNSDYGSNCDGDSRSVNFFRQVITCILRLRDEAEEIKLNFYLQDILGQLEDAYNSGTICMVLI